MLQLVAAGSPVMELNGKRGRLARLCSESSCCFKAKKVLILLAGPPGPHEDAEVFKVKRQAARLLKDSGRLAVLRQRLPQQPLPFGMVEVRVGMGSRASGIAYFTEFVAAGTPARAGAAG